MAEVLKKHYYEGLDERPYIICHTYIYQVSQSSETNKTTTRILVTLDSESSGSYYLNSAGTLTVKVAGVTKASVSGSALNFNFGSYTSKTLLNTTIEIEHDTDGTFSEIFRTELSYGTYGAMDDSDTVVFDTIPRGSVLGDIADFYIEDGITALNFTKYVTEYTHKLEILIGETVLITKNPYEAISGTALTFTDDELLILYNAIAYKSDSIIFRLSTYDGETLIGVASEKTPTGTIKGNLYFKVSGTYRRAIMYIKVDGVWKKTIPYFKADDVWHRGTV